ncbi:hypothetical protein HY495_02710 [Candidatus Woesearchaeota archaeon]|nr:hypothetical protein [Candidatus Woesearchaeota archaeon]
MIPIYIDWGKIREDYRSSLENLTDDELEQENKKAKRGFSRSLVKMGIGALVMAVPVVAWGVVGDSTAREYADYFFGAMMAGTVTGGGYFLYHALRGFNYTIPESVAAELLEERKRKDINP